MSSSQQSSEYLSFPRRIRGGPHPEFGIPRECFCGRDVVLQTSRTTANPGRRYFSCKNSEDGTRHVWKWLDEAMLEQFTIVHLRLKEADESYDLVLRRLGAGEAAVVDPTGRLFFDEIRQIKDALSATETDIVNLKAAVLNQNRGTNVEARHMLIAGFAIICVTVLHLFK